jgi:hypothetical protein
LISVQEIHAAAGLNMVELTNIKAAGCSVGTGYPAFRLEFPAPEGRATNKPRYSLRVAGLLVPKYKLMQSDLVLKKWSNFSLDLSNEIAHNFDYSDFDVNPIFMKTYEYKSIKVKGRFRRAYDMEQMDKSINDSAENGWELVSTAAIATSNLSNGKTNGMILTFKRDKDR